MTNSTDASSMKTKIDISPSYCKCGKQRIFQTLKMHNDSREIGYSCPNRKWFNFWKHDKNTTHAWITNKD